MEREQALDAILLQSGKFQEALDSLLDWLTETEELVANQKPPSAEYKVTKAQMQEQKVSKLYFANEVALSLCEPTPQNETLARKMYLSMANCYEQNKGV